MRIFVSTLAVSCLLASVPFAASAQKVTVQNQGQASLDAEKTRVVAKAITNSVGEPMRGGGQVILFRADNSPGEAIEVSADGHALGGLSPGMYFDVDASGGTHAYAAEGAPLAVEVGAGKTHYVQVIRNRAGNAQLRAVTADKFQRVAGSR